MKSILSRQFYLITLLAVGLSSCGLLDIPVINRILPPKAEPGQEIELQGKAFGETEGKVTFQNTAGEVEAKNLLAWGAESVRLVVPPELEAGEYLVVIHRADDDTRSNNKAFTVLPPSPQTSALLVADESADLLYIYELRSDASTFGPATAGFTASLGQSGYDTQIRTIASVPGADKFYVALTRRSNGEADDRSELLVFTGNTSGVTASTSIDAGIQPSGLALSPDNRYLYVAATSSGMLTVVDTATDTVVDELALDLSTTSYGFEPLSVAVVASPRAALGDHLVAITGNNWFQGQAEVITYAPKASEATDRVANYFPLPDTTLQGSIAVSSATGQAWVTGQRNGLASVSLLDLFQGRVEETKDFAPSALVLSGFESGVTAASDILAVPEHARVFVALPSAGIAEITMAPPGQGLTAETPNLIAAKGVERLAPLSAPSGGVESVLAVIPATGTVMRLPLGGTPEPAYIQRDTQLSAVAQWTPLIDLN